MKRKNDGPFVITERREAEVACIGDPVAGAVKKHTGVYDLRRDGSQGSIMDTAKGAPGLQRLRARQRRLNTGAILDGLGIF